MNNVLSLACIISISLLATSLVSANDQSSNSDPTNSTNEYPMSIEQSVIAVLTEIASKKKENIADAPGIVSVITQDELKRFGGSTLGDILKRVPSILGTTTYLTERDAIAARGDQAMTVPSSHILLLINGRPVREVQEGGIKSQIYKSFPVSVIDHIEIIRGPGSVLYGSQAFSAVFNVVTKKPENNTVSISGSLGEKLANTIMADLEYNAGDFGIVLAGRYADNGLWKTPYQVMGSELHTYALEIPDYGPGFFGELSYHDNKFLNFQYCASYCSWTTQFYVPDLQAPLDLGFLSEDACELTGQEIQNQFFNDIGYSLELSERYRLQANVTYTHTWSETNYNLRNSYEITGEVTNFFTPVKNLNLLLGGTWGSLFGFEEEPPTSTVFTDDQRQTTMSGYTQIDYRWDWCKIIGGLQVNKVEDFDVDFNPRGGILFYPVDHTNIKVLYSTAYRAPSITELYLNHPFLSGKTFGKVNPDWPGDNTFEPSLNPEKNQTFDVCVTYQDETTMFSLNGFHSRMTDLITQNTSGKYINATYDNLSEVTIFGIECEGKWYVTPRILFEGSMLYQYSKDDITRERNVTPLPDFSIKGGLSYQVQWGLTVSAFNTFKEAFDTKYASTLNKSTKYYNMTNVHCSYDFNKLFKFPAAKELSLVLNVDNLFDEEVWLPAWGMKIGSTIPYNSGRIIYGGFNMSF